MDVWDSGYTRESLGPSRNIMCKIMEDLTLKSVEATELLFYSGN